MVTVTPPGSAHAERADETTAPSPELRQRLAGAADRFGTPVYVIETSVVDEAAAAVEAAFPRPWMHQYSLKANDLPAVMEVLAARGWGANVVSAGEWASARAAGVPSSRTTFEGVGKTDDELLMVVDESAAGTPLRWVAVESADELGALARIHALRRREAGRDLDLPVLLRLNPDVQPETAPGLAVGLAASKFGLAADDLVELAGWPVWTGGLRLLGIHVHMGSRLQDVSSWALAGCRAVQVLDRVRTAYAGPGTPDAVDFGGGFPTFGSHPGPADFARALTDELDRAGLSLPGTTAIEPGRVVVGGAGWLVAAVLHTRQRGSTPQAVLDTGMTELIRPALYGSHHPVTALADGQPDALHDVDVQGAVCESTDAFGTHVLPELHRGDLVVLHEAGAYGASFSSRYNGRPPAPEVLLRPDGSLTLGERTPPPPRRRSHELIPTDGPDRSHPDWSQS